ncbi:MAG: TolC family outer membrane protein [Gammaproteobacteria bacterium]|nr:TolC family outer membrane protein [Gammaproteobacteria bacterium]
MLKRLLIVVCAAGLLAPAARAADLWEVWQLATQNDPAFLQARATRNASMQAEPLAWSRLFPSIDLSASRTWTNSTGERSQTDLSSGNLVNLRTASNGRQDQWGATLTQTLFNWEQFMAVQGADYTVAKAQADYQVALQQLMLQVAQTYFNVLNREDVLAADAANLKALQRQYQQTQQQYDVGLIAVTGVRQAQAGYEQARAQVIRDRQLLAQAREALRAITGRFLSHLQTPGQDLPLQPPQPSNVQAWVSTALQENPGLASSRFAQKLAETQVSQQRSGYMPTLNLVLQRLHSSAEGNASACFGGTCFPARPNPSSGVTNTIGLQLSWNIFNGGGTRAAVKQEMYQADAAMAAQIAEQRTVTQNVRNAYLAVLSGIAQVKATRQAVEASRLSLEATEAGLEVGTQTTLDVLTARKNMLSAQKSYFNARYDYLISVLQLEAAAGTLSPEDLKRLNEWLGSSGGTQTPASATGAYPAPAEG